MRDDTWNAMEDLLDRHPILRAEEVAAEEVEAAEAEIGIRLSDDYKQFVERHGGAIVGAFPIFGLRRAAPMDDNDGSFVDVTRGFRRQHWPGIGGWAIISVDHAGNPVGLDNEGRVWISDHDARAVQLLADTFEGYVRKWCLRLPD
jgi:hypothetical protein